MFLLYENIASKPPMEKGQRGLSLQRYQCLDGSLQPTNDPLHQAHVSLFRQAGILAFRTFLRLPQAILPRERLSI